MGQLVRLVLLLGMTAYARWTIGGLDIGGLDVGGRVVRSLAASSLLVAVFALVAMI